VVVDFGVEDVVGSGVAEEVVGFGVVDVVGSGVVEQAWSAPQSKHAEAFDAPSVWRYLPLVQSRQTLTPGVDEYLPSPHNTQSVASSLPSVARYLPTAQSWQAVASDCVGSAAGRRMRIWLKQPATWY
jgi:hypothetical protein